MPYLSDWWARRNRPARSLKQLRSRPGVWVHEDDFEGEAPAPVGPPDVILPRYLLRLEPGAPLPPGVDPRAARYDVVVFNDVPRHVRLPIAVAGALVTAASAAALAAGVPRGVIALPLGLALLGASIRGMGEWTTFRKSETGLWVEAGDDAIVAAETSAGPTPVLGKPLRVGAAVLSVFAFSTIAMIWNQPGLVEIAAAAAIGIGFGAAAILDWLPLRRHDVRQELEAFRRFYELADPARPLTGDELGTPTDPVKALRS
jgi:hypothetical protein